MSSRLPVVLTVHGTRHTLSLPDDVPTRDLIRRLGQRFSLARGSYGLHHSGRRLAPSQTLRQVGVRDGDTLELMSGMAGGTNI